VDLGRRKYLVLVCLAWSLCHGSGLADPGRVFPEEGGDYESSASATGADSPQYVAVFGAENASGSDFSDWTIGNFGAQANLGVEAVNTAFFPAFAAVFGAGDSTNGNFSGWAIGNFGTGANLTVSAISNTSAAPVFATVFGAGNSTDSNFFDWTIGNFGTGANLTASAQGLFAAAAVFGAGNSTDSNFSGWTIGNFGTGANLTVSAINNTSSAAPVFATVFGAGKGSGGNFDRWKIGNFGPTAILNASASGSGSAFAAVFGAGDFTNGNFSGWTIGNFGTGANLTASAQGQFAAAAVFGAGNSTGSSFFRNWEIGNFAPGGKLSSYAAGASGSAFATVFGPGNAWDDHEFRDWTIGNFGPGASLSTFVINTNSPQVYAAVFGAAYTSGVVIGDWTVEFCGSATLSAVGYNSDSASVYLNTLGGYQNENFRFYFNNAENESATVSIAALKLGTALSIISGQSTMTAASNQGQNDSTKYARAVALGPNYQLNVGRTRTLRKNEETGKTNETEASIASGGQPSGSPGTMNIFGAIAKAHDNGSTGTAGSILRIDSGWTVNAYGPVEDLAAIAVNNGTCNTYNGIKNITLTAGNVNAYGESDGIGTITLNGGNLRLAECENTNFNANFSAFESGMRYVGPDGVAYGAGEGNTLNVDATNYPWKGTINGGKLILNSGDNLVFHVNSSHTDPSAKSMNIPGADGVFEFVNGHVAIEEGGSLKLNGGKICLINDAQSSPTFLPAHTDVWLIRTNGGNVIEFNGSNYGNTPLEDVPPIDGTPELTRQMLPAAIVGTSDGCAELDGELKVYMFSAGDGSNPYGGIYIANPNDAPVVAVPSAPATRQANSELAGISVAATSMLRVAAVDSRANAGMSGTGPFAAILGDHLRQSEISGFDYRTNLRGIVCGADHSWPRANSRRSVTLGAVAEYLAGDVHFSGNAAGRGKIVAQKFCSGAVFAVYEGLGTSDLTTNVNLFAGLQRTESKLSRTNENGYAFSGEMNARGQFVALEAVKILCQHETVQIGPWVLLCYNRVCQEGYAEYGNAPDNAGAQTVSQATHNFLNATIGLNAKKECQRTDIQRYISGGFLKCGWQHRALQDHTVAEVQFNSAALASGSYPATFGYPKRNSFVCTSGLRANLNAHWCAAADLHATLIRNQKNCAFSIALGHNF
jgi:hypothetical protein